MDWYAEATFTERMQEARDAAKQSDYSTLGGRVTYKRPPKAILTVEAVAALLGVSTARVKLLCGSGRILGAKRARKGRGSPWVIPAPVRITPGKRGPRIVLPESVTLDLSEEPAPF